MLVCRWFDLATHSDLQLESLNGWWSPGVPCSQLPGVTCSQFESLLHCRLKTALLRSSHLHCPLFLVCSSRVVSIKAPERSYHIFYQVGLK